MRLFYSHWILNFIIQVLSLCLFVMKLDNVCRNIFTNSINNSAVMTIVLLHFQCAFEVEF